MLSAEDDGYWLQDLVAAVITSDLLLDNKLYR